MVPPHVGHSANCEMARMALVYTTKSRNHCARAGQTDGRPPTGTHIYIISSHLCVLYTQKVKFVFALDVGSRVE